VMPVDDGGHFTFTLDSRAHAEIVDIGFNKFQILANSRDAMPSVTAEFRLDQQFGDKSSIGRGHPAGREQRGTEVAQRSMVQFWHGDSSLTERENSAAATRGRCWLNVDFPR
jgi:hypothetical protein